MNYSNTVRLIGVRYISSNVLTHGNEKKEKNNLKFIVAAFIKALIVQQTCSICGS